MIEATVPGGQTVFRLNDRARSQLVGSAGLVVIVLSVAAALLPLADGLFRAAVIGTMMAAAGIAETVAGSLRLRNRSVAVLPGLITVMAGGLFAFQPFDKFVPAVWLVIVWLGARGVVLGAATTVTRGSVRLWTMVAAATDLSLGAALVFGLSASTITLTLFGLTPEILRSFSWVLALSFVATGILLVEVAACEQPRRQPLLRGR